MKHEAIYNLYPNVRTINETEDGIFSAYDENNNLVNVDMPAVEIKAVELSGFIFAFISIIKITNTK